MPRYRQTRPAAGFNMLPFYRVAELGDGEALPAGAVTVDEQTPLCDWTEGAPDAPAPSPTPAPTAPAGDEK